MSQLDDDDLLEALGVEVVPIKGASRTPREERIIAGFEEIQKFVTDNGRFPEHGEGKDIFERLYAVRLDQIRNQEECRNLLKELDHQNLLSGDLTDYQKITLLSGRLKEIENLLDEKLEKWMILDEIGQE